MSIKSTITWPPCQGQKAPPKDAYCPNLPCFTRNPHTRVLVGILSLLRAFLRGRMVNMPAIGPHGPSVHTFLTAYSSCITASSDQPICLRSPHSIIWQGVLRWVMN